MTCALILAAGATNGAAEIPAWSQRSIAGITTTNEIAPPLDVPVAASDPARRALDRLALEDENDTANGWSAPRDRGIAGFGEYREIDETTVDERAEQTRVQIRVEEASRLAHIGQTEEAIQRLSAALTEVRFDSSRFTLYARMGVFAFRAQDYAAAAEHMKSALQFEPNNPAIASNLAAAQMTLGQLDEALATLKGIQVGMIRNPQMLFSIHFNLACLYSLKGQQDEALTHIYRAAESDPASALTSLGDPQLDAIRHELRFRDLQLQLEAMLRPQ